MSNQKLRPGQLIYAYSNGYFPMAHEEAGGDIYWHRPEKRGIIPLDAFHISKNLKRLYRNTDLIFKINTAFREVVQACSDRETTWINDEIIDAYCELSELGYALSFEVWNEDRLVGGLYGVSIDAAFFGESMFSRETNTSKLALIFLVNYLLENNYRLLDTQYLNDHLKQFGAIEISDKKYMKMLESALAKSL